MVLALAVAAHLVGLGLLLAGLVAHVLLGCAFPLLRLAMVVVAIIAGRANGTRLLRVASEEFTG